MNARNKNRRKRQKRTQVPTSRPSTKTPVGSRRSVVRQDDTWRHRLAGRIVSARKKMLAAIGIGIAATIPFYIEGLPHLIREQLTKSPPPLMITPSSDNIADHLPSVLPVPTNLCDFEGTYIIRRSLHLAHTLSTSQLAALITDADAIDMNSTSDIYTLQAAPKETVVITGVHTVLVNRVPAPFATVINVYPGTSCGGGGGGDTYVSLYLAAVNLDGANVKPKIYYVTGLKTLPLIYGLQAKVTYSSPLVLMLNAETKKFDVTWRYQLDYTVNGQQETAWIENGSHPFRMEAERSNDPQINIVLGSRKTWIVTSGGVVGSN